MERRNFVATVGGIVTCATAGCSADSGRNDNTTGTNSTENTELNSSDDTEVNRRVSEIDGYFVEREPAPDMSTLMDSFASRWVNNELEYMVRLIYPDGTWQSDEEFVNKSYQSDGIELTDSSISNRSGDMSETDRKDILNDISEGSQLLDKNDAEDLRETLSDVPLYSVRTTYKFNITIDEVTHPLVEGVAESNENSRSELESGYSITGTYASLVGEFENGFLIV